MEITIGQVLAASVSILTYLVYRWWKDPIRLIPGPPGIPLLGNALTLDVQKMHVQLYEMAQKYGAVTKVSILNIPIVILNTTEVCLEALVKKGTDFQGRPPLPRVRIMSPKDVAGTSYSHPDYLALRKLATKGLKSYGPGVAHLERIMEETVAEIVDILQEKEGQTIDTQELGNGYICCVLASILFGERHSYDDLMCHSLHEMNQCMLKGMDPLTSGVVLDLFPSLLNFKFLFKSVHADINRTIEMIDSFIQPRIDEAKASFDPNNKRGCLDYFIEAQIDGVEGENQIDDDCLKGLLLDFIVGGMETSLSSLSQVFLDMLHEPQLQKRLQAEIDSQFEPSHVISVADREKLPLIDAYLHENMRYMSVTPFLVPHYTLRDTEIAGYKIPANTRVLMNSYYASHNPQVYPQPFKVKLERFLDSNGKLVSAGHPSRHHCFVFGAGRRICPAENLARTRIFLFLANILQKFNIEPVDELPDRDVRNYKLGVILSPPPVTALFHRRQ